jgi:uncharacterized protein YebE (UPF0316 family)
MIELFAGPWGPLLIFLLRIVDVSMGTMRMLFIVRGARVPASTIAFFEILIWVVAAGAAVNNLGSPLHLIGYAGGFATGTLVGVEVEKRLALGIATVQAFSRGSVSELEAVLRSQGFGVTKVIGEGEQGEVSILSIISRRREVPQIIDDIEAFDPDAFIAVYDDTHVRRGWIPGVRGK